MLKNILVVAAHPDDEVFGCAGTIARYVSEGKNVGVIFLADGVSSRNDNFSEDVKKRRQSAEKALMILGVKFFKFFNFPDNRLDTVAILEIIKTIEQVIIEFSPNVVYTHHSSDLNIDHTIVHKATMTACRPLPQSTIKEIYTYEVVSSTGWTVEGTVFTPNYFVDIENYWEKKLSAINAYDDEMRTFPHVRSIESLEALSKYRGSFVGIKKAEAFFMARRILI